MYPIAVAMVEWVCASRVLRDDVPRKDGSMKAVLIASKNSSKNTSKNTS